ncbi:MAG: hypothetical protein PHY08_00875 [Candidatus Cloacimonetes bacterium]|nr:hypothetical protein [Candidatus Cloacimonadota bacterium]
MLGDIQSFRSLFSKYTELRVQENRTGYLTLLKGDLINNTSAAIKGVSARVFDQGGVGILFQFSGFVRFYQKYH